MSLLSTAKGLLGYSSVKKGIAEAVLNAPDIGISPKSAFMSVEKSLPIAKKAGSSVLKYLGELASPILQIPKKIVTYASSGIKPAVVTAGVGTFVAAGGLKLVPPLLSAESKAVKKTVDYFVPPASPYKEVKPYGYLENQFSKEKPPYKEIGETVGLGLGLAALGTTIGLLIDKLTDKEKDTVLSTDTTVPSSPNLPVTPSSSTPVPQPSPITPQTQVLGREAGLPAKRKKRKAKIIPQPKLTIRNQNFNIVGVRN